MTDLSLDVSAPRTRTSLWLNAWRTGFVSLPNRLQRILKTTAAVVGLLLMALVITVPLDLYAQCIFGLACFAAMLMIRRLPGRIPVLALVVLSLLASLRYMYWRLTSTLDFENWLDSLLGYGLVVAEFYTLVVIVLGYVQTAWPLHRKPVIMPSDIREWPTVDVFIPSYNEALSIVKLTIFAAQSMDWPKDKLRVHVLDDGRREDFREFCEQIGVGYVTRDNNRHAKAGNLNEALKVTDGEYVAMFDADHVPTRSFLQVTMGWFLKDPKLAMLQTPHFFFSPDPFEKNLDTFRTVPNEGELFYGLLQDGNDLWNATFFCGSCAVLRRSSLLEIGGVATETVTEDAHTALKLNRAGYNTAYLAIPQAAGLATESLSRHVAQRIRWARGMAQIFRTDNPFLGKGLSLGQRLCYANSMLHFFYGLPRLVFLTAPLAYLLFGAQIMHASALMITAYVIPHILHASLTNSAIQGRFRHSFWNEVYEAVLAWYIMGPVLMALVNPKFGGFNVTDKGGVIEEQFFDWKLARPYIVLLTLNVVVFGIGLMTLYELGWNNDAITLTIVINMAWTIYNIIITSAAIAVASEIRQVRAEPRVQAKLPIRITRADGVAFDSTTQDFSQTGLGLVLPANAGIQSGDTITVSLFRGAQSNDFPARVMFCRDGYLGARFDDLSLRQQSELVRLTFGRADTWASTWGHGKRDTPLMALREVSHIGVRGIVELLKATRKDFARLLPLRKRPSSPPAN
ncbi:UDP-forming cellulose synthase catalytic subunit [Pseudomonas floridensis]|uniref:Cellulose synthase catalytic subunit [UDP-forming] n=1 Tax=Pseudomonas floridensis TaxID=1958950 RepID=A0A1X0NAL9_9PSED|nr:UDP-forming cellulose synthase catalytic subunit [Pseudomonas floridensis]ORC61176.1 UDP-forming cellulose synthase catalytic subunit [Pseudomonas floridensis]